MLIFDHVPFFNISTTNSLANHQMLKNGTWSEINTAD